VGHTGDLEAVIRACTTVDKCLGELLQVRGCPPCMVNAASSYTVFCRTLRNVPGCLSCCCSWMTGLETCHLQAFVGDVWCFRTTTSASNILHIPSAPTAVVQVVEESNGRWLIASDHGNSDDMVQVSCAQKLCT
jgi:hypothetical protein